MKQLNRTIRMVAISTLAVILAACTSPTVVVSPTQDIPSIRTESASTVIAQLTLDAALNPTATTAPTSTPPAATETTAPTSTVAPTMAGTNTPIPTFTPAVSSNTSGGTSGGTTISIYPTATFRAGPDLAVLVDQTPKDGAVYQPGQEFDGVFTLKNTGTSTWTKDFIIRVNKDRGTNIAKQNFFPLPTTATPGQTIKAFADLVAPTTTGRYVTYWELCNANDDIFYTFYTVIDVK